MAHISDGNRGLFNLYKYRLSIFARMYSVIFFVAAILGGFGLWMIIDRQIDESYLYPGVAIIIIALFFVWGMWRFYSQHLPISVNDDGISTLAFGRWQHFISWPSVQRIEKIRFQDPMWGMDRNRFRVISPDDQIAFDDGVKELEECLDAINLNIRGRDIELIFIDRGRDTYEKTQTTVADPKQRRRLMRDGVNVSLSKL